MTTAAEIIVRADRKAVYSAAGQPPGGCARGVLPRSPYVEGANHSTLSATTPIGSNTSKHLGLGMAGSVIPFYHKKGLPSRCDTPPPIAMRCRDTQHLSRAREAIDHCLLSALAASRAIAAASTMRVALKTVRIFARDQIVIAPRFVGSQTLVGPLRYLLTSLSVQ